MFDKNVKYQGFRNENNTREIIYIYIHLGIDVFNNHVDH